MSKRFFGKSLVLFTVLLALLAGTFVALAQQSSVQAKSASTISKLCPDIPGGATQPVRCYRSSIRIVTHGFDISCVEFDNNPPGYITYYSYIIGWSYRDAKGIRYFGLWNSGNGPYTVTKIIKRHRCGWH